MRLGMFLLPVCCLVLCSCQRQEPRNDADAILTPVVAGRDFSTPASRLIGKWANIDPDFGSKGCDYYGPVDPATKLGVLHRYSFDPNASTMWTRVDHRYQVISQDPAGERVTVNLLLENGRSITQTYNVRHHGRLFRYETTFSDGTDLITNMGYIGGSDKACTEK